MNAHILLVKCIILLFKEHCLVNRNENSADLVKTVIEKIKVNEQNLAVNTARDVTLVLRGIALEMASNGVDHEYDPELLLREMKLACGENEALYDALENGLAEASSEAVLKRSIVSLRKSVQNFFREQTIDEILTKASYQFKFQREKIKDVGLFISETINNLEPLTMSSVAKDPAVMGDMDMSDDESINKVLNEIEENNNNDGVLKTGWVALNEMLQGGFRRGEFTIINALQHKYKTGFSLSLFKQICTNNTPYMVDKKKKPLMLRISFEDDLDQNVLFLYKAFKYEETRTYVSMHDVTKEEIKQYVKSKMGATGYHIKMMRVDPTQWTYKNICNTVLELEAEGYEIHCLAVDYLAMVPRIGCINTGPTGSDLRDMFRRMRNFCSSRRITFITPHQMNPDAKRLIRSGIPEVHFVKEVAEKGYTDSCSTLDQEVDLELYIHKLIHNKEPFFTVQRGKHRLPSIIEEDQKFMIYKFPKGMPIPEDINDETPSHMRKLPTAPASTGTDDSMFSFDSI